LLKAKFDGLREERRRMVEPIPFRGNRSSGGGGGPDDPMIERRIARLEELCAQIDEKLARIDANLGHLPTAMDYAALRSDVAEMKGRFGGLEMRLSAMPTTVQLVTWLITTWSAGAAIVFALLRFSPK
jgi:hypothetical protein